MLAKSTRSAIVAEARASLDAFQSRVVDIDRTIQTNFGRFDEPLAKSLERFAKCVSAEAVAKALPNPEMNRLLELAFDECNFAVHHLSVIERWVNLQMPHRESGDNFGADVIMDVLKLLQERNSFVGGTLSELPNYYIGRASVLEKVVGQTKTTQVVRKVTKHAQVKADGNGAEKKRSKVEAEEESSSAGKTSTTEEATEEETSVQAARVLEDFRQYVAHYDAKWLWTLRDCMRACQDTYLLVLDIVEKNRDKIDKPKNAHSNHFS